MNKDIEKVVSDIRGQFNTDGLIKFLSNKIENDAVTLGINTPQWQLPITIKQFTFGQSNPTYLIIDGNNKLSVLRRKPSPNNKLVSKSAHAIEREFFILNGINKLNQTTDRKVPIPDTYLLCEDESIIGYVFYVMEFIEGKAIKNPEMVGIPSDQQEELWSSIMDTLTSIHSLDSAKLIELLPEKHFPQFKKPSDLPLSYFERQTKTLSNVSNMQTKLVEAIPHFNDISNYILKSAPKDPVKQTLIHGDFKIDNLIFDKNSNRVMAVLDWELCTFGHPLFDLANLLQPFQLPKQLNTMFFSSLEITIGRENPKSLALIEDQLKLYHQKLGWKWNDDDSSNNALDKWTVGFVFGLFRLCVISQGIAMRISKGTASSANAAGAAKLYPLLSRISMDNINTSKL